MKNSMIVPENVSPAMIAPPKPRHKGSEIVIGIKPAIVQSEVNAIGSSLEIKAPENAHKDDLALDGWSCNREYVKRGDKCEKFTLPEHAFYSGDTWKCELGYRKNPTADRCDKISLPENAHYTDIYDGWLCNNGYIKNYKENRCDKNS